MNCQLQRQNKKENGEENMKNLEQFEALTSAELSNVEGGVIPLAVWAIWGAAAGAGFGGGVAVGLNYVNRH